jgi:hypothetical protein
MAQAMRSEPTVGELLGSLANETGALVRQELRLASTEMGRKAKTAALDAGVIGAGGALAHAGLLAVVFGVVLALGAAIPMWLSALIIGLVGLGGGYALIRRGLNGLRGLDAVPQQTVRTLREDKVFMKEQLR